jgi:hypothetical protein
MTHSLSLQFGTSEAARCTRLETDLRATPPIHEGISCE